MVSRFSYYSFKDFDLRKRVPFVAVLAIVLLFVFLTLGTAEVLFFVFFAYMLSGPLVSLYRWHRKRTRQTEVPADGGHAEPGEQAAAASSEDTSASPGGETSAKSVNEKTTKASKN